MITYVIIGVTVVVSYICFDNMSCFGSWPSYRIVPFITGNGID